MALNVQIAHRISRWCPEDCEYWDLEFSRTNMRAIENPPALGMRCLREGTEGQNQSQGLCDVLMFRRRQNQGFRGSELPRLCPGAGIQASSARLSPAHSVSHSTRSGFYSLPGSQEDDI